MYLVDSFAGEVIQPWAERYKAEIPAGADQADSTPQIDQENHVDFRYSDLCLMLFLDGHAEMQSKWQGIEELEGFVELTPGGQIDLSFGDYDPANRGIRIRQLDKRISSVVNP